MGRWAFQEKTPLNGVRKMAHNMARPGYEETRSMPPETLRTETVSLRHLLLYQRPYYPILLIRSASKNDRMIVVRSSLLARQPENACEKTPSTRGIHALTCIPTRRNVE